MQTAEASNEPENIQSEKIGFIDYVCDLDRADISEMLELRVIPSFIGSMRRHLITVFNNDALKLWLVDMLLSALKDSTIRRYLGALHTLYKQYASLADAKDKDVDFSISLDGIYSPDTPAKIKEIEKNLSASKNLWKASVKDDSQEYIYMKVFQYLLFNPFASLTDVVNLKYSDEMPPNMHIEDVVNSMRNAPQAQYVFRLQQGKRREPAIVRSLLSDLHATGRRAGLSFGDSFSRESITEIWIAAALKAGVPYSEITGMIRNLPTAYSFLSLIPPKVLSEQKKTDIMNIVADIIANKTPGWFVLRLRSGVTPDDIKDRLDDRESPLRRMISYFYPMRPVKRMVKKRMVTKQKPIIPGILFIRLPYDRVNPLIGMIGDLAWCYRTSANVSSPYSVIPQSEMKVFQRSVGAYTSDIEMDIVSSLPPLAVGDEVVIENGSMLDGQQAVIRKVRSANGKVSYTLRLSDTAFIRWEEVTLPASNISKIEK